MDLSIIVPIYNTGKDKLARCFSSICEISGIQYECLLVDDGSNADIALFCEGIANNNPFFRYIRKDNGGVSSARNLGIRCSRGAYICFVDSDDAVEPDVYCNLNMIMKDWKYDVIFTDLIAVHVNNTVLWSAFEAKGAVTYEAAIERMEQDSTMNGPYCKFIKRDFLEAQGILFDETMIYGEDAVFLMQLLQKKPQMWYLDAVGYYYYHSLESGDKRFVKDPDCCIDNVIQQYKIAIQCLKKGNFDEARRIELIKSRNSQMIFGLFGSALNSVEFGVYTPRLQDKIQAAVRNIQDTDLPEGNYKIRLRRALLMKRNWAVFKMAAYLRKLNQKRKGLR